MNQNISLNEYIARLVETNKDYESELNFKNGLIESLQKSINSLISKIEDLESIIEKDKKFNQSNEVTSSFIIAEGIFKDFFKNENCENSKSIVLTDENIDEIFEMIVEKIANNACNNTEVTKNILGNLNAAKNMYKNVKKVKK